MAAIMVLGGCMRAGEHINRPDQAPEGGWWDAAGWQRFLAAWNHDVLEALGDVEPGRLTAMESAVLRSGTLAHPAAPPAAIAALETRLGQALPPSYKAFLGVSGGWTQIAMDAEDGELWPPDRVRWFKDQDPGWITAWTTGLFMDPDDDTYFIYGDRQDPVHLRRGYLPTTLAVSRSIEAAVYLLNPKVRTTRGEWEAWLFGNALPGAQRYTSFQALMMAERPRVLASLRAANTVRRRGPGRP